MAAPPGEDAERVLAFAVNHFRGGIALATSLGPQTLVLIEMAHRLGLDLPVFCLDTGLLWDETHDLRRRIEERYGVQIRVVRPKLSLAEQSRRYGAMLWQSDPDLCCRLRKIEPLSQALYGLDA